MEPTPSSLLLLLLLLLLAALGLFPTVSSQGCDRPDLPPNVDSDEIQRYFNPGEELALSCRPGHTPVLGPRTIVCTEQGHWTRTRLICTPISCPFPDPLSNGELHLENNQYQDIVNYTCHAGFTMFGMRSVVCQANGTWSAPAPRCKPVTCDLAPVPQFGIITYDRIIKETSTEFGVSASYGCLPPYVLVGNARAKCTADGTWTETPECQVVVCPPPENIHRGYMSTDHERDFDFKETVKYGCHGDYVLEGNLEIVCQSNGQWSERPSCKAPCRVGISRGRILYKGQRLWIGDLDPNRVLHRDQVSVYCLNQARGCGYPVVTQCIDGTLLIPECYEEPSAAAYTFSSGSLPSEIAMC